MITLKLIGLTFICVMGLKIALSEDMLLEKVGAFFEKKIDEGHKIYMLLYCPWCMSTLQSFTAYAFAFGLGILPWQWDDKLLIRWPLVVMASSLLGGLTWTIYQTINKIHDKNEAEAYYIRSLFEAENENLPT